MDKTIVDDVKMQYFIDEIKRAYILYDGDKTELFGIMREIEKIDTKSKKES